MCPIPSARNAALSATTILSLAAAAAPAQPNSFRGIGWLTDENRASAAYGISADGSTVVGIGATLEPGSWRAIRWRADEGMTNIGSIPSPLVGQARGVAASTDGSFVVGRIWESGPNVQNAFRWSEPTGMALLGQLDPLDPTPITNSLAVSGDGAVVVGFSDGRPFRWTQETGMAAIPSIFEGYRQGIAKGISADGAVITGSFSRPGRTEAFRWTAETGAVGIGVGVGVDSNANAISADGTTIVGRISRTDPNLPFGVVEAFRWTQETGIVGLGHMATQPEYSEAVAVSGDGSVVVGWGRGSWIWDEARGLRSLEQAFVEAGLDLTGWRLENVYGISADGRTIVGTGRGPIGASQGWIAVIPAPGVVVAALVPVLVAARRRRG